MGIALFRGDFNQSGRFKIVFSGDDISYVYIDTPWDSPINEIDTTNSAGVIFDSYVALNKFTGLDNVLFDVDIVNSKKIILDEDVVINAYIVNSSTVIDLNGHKLTINNDLQMDGGTIYVNGGILEVGRKMCQSGGYIDVDGGKIIVHGNYELSDNAHLSMDNMGDYTLVYGDFIAKQTVSSRGYYTDGILEIKGNLIEKDPGNISNQYGNFYQSTSFCVKLSGDSIQKVNIENCYNCKFYNLVIEESAGVEFESAISVKYFNGFEKIVGDLSLVDCELMLSKDETINKSLQLCSVDVNFNGYNLRIKGNLTIKDSKIELGNTLTVEGKCIISRSEVFLNANAFYIRGNLCQTDSDMYIGKGDLHINGDYTIGGNSLLYMTHEEDILYVGGSFSTFSKKSEVDKLTAGVFMLRGNFTQSGNAYSFAATSGLNVDFCGDSEQVVLFNDPDYSRIIRYEGSENESNVIFKDKKTNVITLTLSFYRGLGDAILDNLSAIYNMAKKPKKLLESLELIADLANPSIWIFTQTDEIEIIKGITLGIIDTVDNVTDEVAIKLGYGSINEAAEIYGYTLGQILFYVLMECGTEKGIEVLQKSFQNGKLGELFSKLPKKESKSEVLEEGKTILIAESINSVDDLVEAGITSVEKLKKYGFDNVEKLSKVGVESTDDLVKIGINSADDL